MRRRVKIACQILEGICLGLVAMAYFGGAGVVITALVLSVLDK